ncbi:hypothetical protein KCP75_25695 [Salmonella enterica subsp. enterica]|nr:hypothetical protein KCP75_25695 [Salmonella enterica subsp. enterica]
MADAAATMREMTTIAYCRKSAHAIHGGLKTNTQSIDIGFAIPTRHCRVTAFHRCNFR